ncbi:MAG: FAD-binding domain-containing protein [Pseudomonadota bacterium]
MSPTTLETRERMTKAAKKTPVQVVWFKRDLRTVDHQALALAAEHGPVLPLLIVEPGWWAEPDMSARQYAFYCECVGELQLALADMRAKLVVRVGHVIDVLSEIAELSSIAGLWSHEETGNAWTFRRDREVSAWCRVHGIAWKEVRQDGVIRRLETRNGWAGRWDKRMGEAITSAPAALAPAETRLDSQAMPAAKDLGLAADDPSLRQIGGRSVALDTLNSFLNERGEPYRAAMSSPVSGERACSRLSPYLAWGAVSMREVAQATWTRQRALKLQGGPEVREWRGSLISFTGRLHWHCHFMQKLEDEPQLEFRNLHRSYDAIRKPEETDAARLHAWCAGETGLPFVDASMRYLAATGWLNFRMRAMLMATASYHLWLHWRAPGLHLARQFTDYEPGIHWPQSQMQSGTTGINTVRIYNPVKQGYDQDPDGDFVRRWLPELESIPGPDVHEPWKHPLAAGILDKTYPTPIIDHQEAAREARQKIYGARRGPAFRDEANAIQNKHGSRKSGMPMTGQRKASAPRRSKAKADTGQMAMELEAPATAAEPAAKKRSPVRGTVQAKTRKRAAAASSS